MHWIVQYFLLLKDKTSYGLKTMELGGEFTKIFHKGQQIKYQWISPNLENGACSNINNQPNSAQTRKERFGWILHVKDGESECSTSSSPILSCGEPLFGSSGSPFFKLYFCLVYFIFLITSNLYKNRFHFQTYGTYWHL